MSIWEPDQDVRITVLAKTGKEKDHRIGGLLLLGKDLGSRHTYMLTRSAISAILAVLSLVSEWTRLYDR